MARANSYLSKVQIKTLKNKLLGDKERILNKDADKQNYCMDTNELSDPVDEASVNAQASQAIRFRNREVFYLKKINKTLKKMDTDDYGLCNECDDEVGFDRLMARPTAELCITCKEESEHVENNNAFMRRSKSLGKTIAELGRR